MNTTILQVLNSRYGVTIFQADATTFLWAIDWLLENNINPDTLKRELRKLNAKRFREGKSVVYIPYGHPLV